MRSAPLTGARALGEREQRGEDRRTRVQDDAAHMGIVEIEDVPHLAVGERRVEQPEPQLAAEYPRLRPAAGLLEHRNQLGDGGMGAAGQRAADPVEHAAAGLVHGGRREIAEACAGQVATQRLGQGDGGGVEVLVHRWALGDFRRGPEERKWRRALLRGICAPLYLKFSFSQPSWSAAHGWPAVRAFEALVDCRDAC